MEIVVLDGATMNPGDLDWAILGPCRIFERTLPEQTVERCGNAEIVITNKVVLDEAVLAQLPQLRYIGVSGTGYNVVDTAAAARRGIVVTNVPAYSTMSVAQLTFAHILNLANRLGEHAESVREGDWSRSADFCYWLTPQLELAGKTLGIYGFGAIGQAVARIGLAFGMNILAYRRTPPATVPAGIAMVSEERLFAESDIVTLHCPLTPETHHLIDRERLRSFKPGAWLVNTGRGPLLDDRAVADALNAGLLGGAGLDVLTQEPPPPEQPLLQAKNCWITPHLAWATREARQRLLDTVAANIAAFRQGTPQNRVN